MDCGTPGFPVHHQLPELAQTRVHQVTDAIQPSHLWSRPSLLSVFFRNCPYESALPFCWRLVFLFVANSTHATQTEHSKLGEECQGCILPPWLFNLYVEYIIWNAGLDDSQAGIKIAERNINNLRCANDTTLMEESEEKSLDERGGWKSWLKTQHSKN